MQIFFSILCIRPACPLDKIGIKEALCESKWSRSLHRPSSMLRFDHRPFYRCSVRYFLDAVELSFSRLWRVLSFASVSWDVLFRKRVSINFLFAWVIHLSVCGLRRDAICSRSHHGCPVVWNTNCHLILDLLAFVISVFRLTKGRLLCLSLTPNRSCFLRFGESWMTDWLLYTFGDEFICSVFWWISKPRTILRRLPRILVIWS